MENITRKDIEESKKKQGISEKTDKPQPYFLSEMKINGGVLKEVTQDGMHGVMYYGNNGETCFFSGVRMTSNPLCDGAAFQLKGIIFVSPGWASRGFNVYDFAHEYGHYIQEMGMPGMLYYPLAIGSVYSYLTSSPEEHMSKPFEVQATSLGNKYLLDNMHRPYKKS